MTYKHYCPACGCTMGRDEDGWYCEDPECAYVMEES